MRRVIIAGVGMTQFGKQTGRGVRDMSLEAADLALRSAGMDTSHVERVYYGNAIAGTVTQQVMIRGQVAFRGHPLGALPLINIENACASGGSAFLLAIEAVASGSIDCALAVGAEQMSHPDRSRAFNALRGSTDIEDIGEGEPGSMSANSILMDYYAEVARSYLDTYGAEPADFARVPQEEEALTEEDEQHKLANYSPYGGGFPEFAVRRSGLRSVFGAWCALAWAARALKPDRLPSTIEHLLREKRLLGRSGQESELRALGTAFARARTFVPIAPRCLVDSLALYRMALSRSLAPSLVFGVRTNPFAAHCWLQTGACVLTGTAEEARNYQPILVV